MVTIRSLANYSTPALLALTPRQFESLEVIKNNALCLTMGALMWTILCNLWMEGQFSSFSDGAVEIKHGLIARICKSMGPHTKPHLHVWEYTVHCGTLVFLIDWKLAIACSAYNSAFSLDGGIGVKPTESFFLCPSPA